MAYDEQRRERQRRQEAVNAAVVSVQLEGFVLSEKFLAEAQRFVRCEIELEDFMKFVSEHAK